MARSVRHHRRICLSLRDNLGEILASEKGRSNGWKLRRQLLYQAAYRVGCHICWRRRHVRSEPPGSPCEAASCRANGKWASVGLVRRRSEARPRHGARTLPPARLRAFRRLRLGHHASRSARPWSSAQTCSAGRPSSLSALCGKRFRLIRVRGDTRILPEMTCGKPFAHGLRSAACPASTSSCLRLTSARRGRVPGLDRPSRPNVRASWLTPCSCARSIT